MHPGSDLVGSTNAVSAPLYLLLRPGLGRYDRHHRQVRHVTLTLAVSHLAMAGTAYSDGNRVPELDRCRRWRKLGRFSPPSAHVAAERGRPGWWTGGWVPSSHR
jgi:hypothetical protein